jgi:hypothetical protein
VSGKLVTYSVKVPDGARGTLRLGERYRAARMNGRELAPGIDAELLAGQHTITFELAA